MGRRSNPFRIQQNAEMVRRFIRDRYQAKLNASADLAPQWTDTDTPRTARPLRLVYAHDYGRVTYVKLSRGR